MKKNILTSAIALVAILFLSTNVSAQQYQVVAESSNANWLAKKVTGQHEGTVAVKKGNISKGRKGMTGNFTIDLSNMACTDMEGEYAEKLIKHLKSADFFNVEEFPTATFNMMRLAESPNREAGTTHVMYGEIDIKGIKKAINFPVSLLIENDMLTASGKIILDRTDFNVKYGSGKFFEGLGDKMIYDEFELDINIVAKEATTKSYSKKGKKKKSKKN